MMRVGEQVDPDRPNYTLEEAAGVIDEVRIGIEIARSPFTGINDNGAAVTVSDLGNSKALMIGAVVPFGGQTDFVSWPVTTTVDSKMVGEGRADALPDGPFGAVRFLLEHLAQRGIALPVGSWISTGAITGVHVISVGTRVVATFGSDYRIVCTTHPFTAG
jgi:2-keto-4-pentenoate hydratase